MLLTSLGHAGFLIQTGDMLLLCDPWFTPAYFDSWNPFPSNENVDYKQMGEVTHLYISHLHRDHFDRDFLLQFVSKNTKVILPDFPLNDLEEGMREIGFKHFIYTNTGKSISITDEITVTVHSFISPVDGPFGDSSLLIDDGIVKVLHLNDARPQNPHEIVKRGLLDALLLQFSGASWYPVAHDISEEEKRCLGIDKRINQFRRALFYIDQFTPGFIIPCAGPPCFLDDDLLPLNELNDDPSNIFPDQMAFLKHLEMNGIRGGRM